MLLSARLHLGRARLIFLLPFSSALWSASCSWFSIPCRTHMRTFLRFAQRSLPAFWRAYSVQSETESFSASRPWRSLRLLWSFLVISSVSLSSIVPLQIWPSWPFPLPRSMWSTRTSIQEYRCRLRSHGVFGDLFPLPRLRHHNWDQSIWCHGQIGYLGRQLYRGRHAHMVPLVICTTLHILPHNTQPWPIQADARHVGCGPCRIFCELFLRPPFQVERSTCKHIRCFHNWGFGELVFTVRSRVGSYCHSASHLCAGSIGPCSKREFSQWGDERESDYKPLNKWNLGEWYDNGQWWIAWCVNTKCGCEYDGLQRRIQHDSGVDWNYRRVILERSCHLSARKEEEWTVQFLIWDQTEQIRFGSCI